MHVSPPVQEGSTQPGLLLTLCEALNSPLCPGRLGPRVLSPQVETALLQALVAGLEIRSRLVIPKRLDEQESSALALSLHFTREQFSASQALRPPSAAAGLLTIVYYRTRGVRGDNSIVYDF